MEDIREEKQAVSQSMLETMQSGRSEDEAMIVAAIHALMFEPVLEFHGMVEERMILATNESRIAPNDHAGECKAGSLPK